MAKRKAKSEIAREDCPENPAIAYPGKYGRNNRGGSVLTREEFKEEAVRNWVDHFDESEKYQNTPLGHKAIYLARHLKRFNVDAKEARALIVKVESAQTREVAEQEQNPVVQGDDDRDGDGNSDRDGEGTGDAVEQMEVGDGGEIGGEGDVENDMDYDEDNEDSDFEEDNDEEDYHEQEVDEETRVQNEFEVKRFMEKSDNELFKSGLEIPLCVEKSAKFKERKKMFIKDYIEEQDFQDSQEILESLSQAPPVVEDTLKKKLKHISRQEKANRLVLKTLIDTLHRLRETPGREARKQVQIILAAVTHHRYGTPALPGQSWRLELEAKEMKRKLLTGEDQILTPPPKTKKDVFPAEVTALAKEHWRDTTIPEPSVNRRMKRKEKQLKRGEQAVETIPTRWQHMTAEEQYASFKEDCEGKVRVEMEKKAATEIERVSTRPESDDKTRRLERLENLCGLFPGKKWYSDQKPEEVKPLVDHTTGLCRVCEAAGLNYLTMYKTLQRLCACKTRFCPNWTCFCVVDEIEEDPQDCQCRCSCDGCLACQVHTLK